MKRLKRVIQKKDLVIDMLMERVVKLQRNQPNERSSSSSNQDVLSSSATSLDVSNGGDSVICTQQSPGTSTPTETVGRPTTVASTVQSSKVRYSLNIEKYGIDPSRRIYLGGEK